MIKKEINNIIKESFILSFFIVFNSWIEEIYAASLTHRLSSRFSQRLKEISKQSFCGQLTAKKRSGKNDIFDHSLIIKAILPIFKRVTDRISFLFSESLTQRLFRDFKASFKKGSVRLIGCIIIIALLVNLLLLLIFQGLKISSMLIENSYLLGAWFRLLLLIIAVILLFCNEEFYTIKKTSFFYQWLANSKRGFD